MKSQYKFLLDILPLVTFLLLFKLVSMPAAIIGLIISTFIALGVTWLFERHVALMPLITAVLVGVFGGLSLWLHDERFIKMKPTVIYAIIGLILLVGCWRGRALLRAVTGQALQMTDRGWWLLSFRFGCFFLGMACLNEIIWRSMSTEAWVNFKVFGGLGLTLIFSLAQSRLIMRHQLDTPS